jgi:hypothetical protein
MTAGYKGVKLESGQVDSYELYRGEQSEIPYYTWACELHQRNEKSKAY